MSSAMEDPFYPYKNFEKTVLNSVERASLENYFQILQKEGYKPSTEEELSFYRDSSNIPKYRWNRVFCRVCFLGAREVDVSWFFQDFPSFNASAYVLDLEVFDYVSSTIRQISYCWIKDSQ